MLACLLDLTLWHSRTLENQYFNNTLFMILALIILLLVFFNGTHMDLNSKYSQASLFICGSSGSYTSEAASTNLPEQD